MRLHGWAVARWWFTAGTLWAVLTVAHEHPNTVVWALSAAVGLWLRFRTKLKYGFLVSVPLGLVMKAHWSTIIDVTQTFLFIYAVWQTLEWYATTLTLTVESFTVKHGIVNTKTTRIPQRRLVQAQQERTILGKLFGYAHLGFETASDEEFVDRIRFVHPNLYTLVTDRTALTQTLTQT